MKHLLPILIFIAGVILGHFLPFGGKDTSVDEIMQENTSLEAGKDILQQVNDSLNTLFVEKDDIINKLREHIEIYETTEPLQKEHEKVRAGFRVSDDTALVGLITGQHPPEGY